MKKKLIPSIFLMAFVSALTAISSASELIDEGMSAFERKEYAKAATIFLRALSQRSLPSDSRALLYYNAAASYYNIQSFPDAIDILEKGIREYPLKSNFSALLASAKVENTLLEGNKLEETYQYDKAILLYQTAIESFRFNDHQLKSRLFYNLSYAHYLTGDLTSALQIIGKSLNLNSNNMEYLSFQNHLKELMKPKLGEERSHTYHALRSLGSADQLTGRNGILHIFAEGRNSIKWSPSKVQSTLKQVENASHWLTDEARKRNIHPLPTFIHRKIMTPNFPLLKNNDIPSYTSDPTYTENWLKALLASFNVSNFKTLFSAQSFPDDLRSRSVVIHTNQEDRSFALPLEKAHYESDLEVALVYFRVKKLTNPFQAVVYSHELLHLYGADDLYDKIEDTAFTELEIMHFGGYRLENNYLCQLTTYAIGWSKSRPDGSQLQIMLPHKLAKRKETTP
ncbi:hypothetical protein BVX98_05225 [bacterium F11]|nr:hypothetical protein BVX98_05225 [bacterium F11]